MPLRIRMANIDDAISMSIIHAKSWQKAYQGLLPDEYLNGIKDDRWVNMISRGLKDKSMKAWIASAEEKSIACACIGDSRYPTYEHQLELISIYVLPEYWHSGAGALLLNKVLEYAAANDYNEVGLWVLTGNKQAIKFYEKFGFTYNGDTLTNTLGGAPAVEKRYIKAL